MRSVWCTVVAVTLVLAGARVGGAERRSAAHTELHVAKSVVVAPSVRRARDTANTLDALVGVAPIELPAPPRSIAVAETQANLSQPAAQPDLVRSSRGPPQA